VERDPDNAAAAALLDELRADQAREARERSRIEVLSAKASSLRAWLDAVRLAAERRAR
jgi:hypothetical protein